MTSVAPAVRYNPEPVIVKGCESKAIDAMAEMIKACNGVTSCETKTKVAVVEMVKACDAPPAKPTNPGFNWYGFAGAMIGPLILVVCIIKFGE